MQGGQKTILLGPARHALRSRTVSAGCFHDQDVDVFLGEFCPAHQSLILEVDVARIENPPAFRFKKHAGRTKNMARVAEFRGQATTPEVKPFP